MVIKAIKKPIPIECIQWNGNNFEEIKEFCGKTKDGADWVAYEIFEDTVPAYCGEHLGIRTLEGDHRADFGDYIIKGVRGECYPCKKDIFEETYDILK